MIQSRCNLKRVMWYTNSNNKLFPQLTAIFFLLLGHYVDDDFQRRLDQILLDIKGLEDLIRDIQSPKKSSEKEVKEKIKVGPETIGRRMFTDRSSHLIWKSYMNREFGDNF